MPIERGEVYWVAFDPSVGGEIQKTRPAIIISNNASNLTMNRVQVVPISSKTRNLYPGEALIELRGEKRKAIASQLATASMLRLRSRVGTLSKEDLGKVEDAVLLQLGLDRS
jgi:mRNA interferase MazF